MRLLPAGDDEVVVSDEAHWYLHLVQSGRCALRGDAAAPALLTAVLVEVGQIKVARPTQVATVALHVCLRANMEHIN